MKSRLKRKLKSALSWEIAIEYKVCLYFSCIMFFYCVYLLYNKIYFAGVVNMFEMILTAYAAGYIQVCLFHNFDEAEQLGKRDIWGMIFCTCFYALVSYLLDWFEKGFWITLLFAIYMLLIYLCVYLCNKIKRIVDTENLNKMLTDYKKGEECNK